jgi:hypothetical protein
MKKIFGILAIVSVISFALIGCTPQAEGDTAPAPEAGKAGAGASTATPPTAPDGK